MSVRLSREVYYVSDGSRTDWPLPFTVTSPEAVRVQLIDGDVVENVASFSVDINNKRVTAGPFPAGKIVRVYQADFAGHPEEYRDEITSLETASREIAGIIARGMHEAFSGEWRSDRTYRAGSLVIFDNSMWVASAPNRGEMPGPSTSYWVKIFTFPPTINWAGEWQAGRTYYPGDLVSRAGSAYVCKARHTAGSGNDPSTAGVSMGYWDVFVRPPVAGDVFGPSSSQTGNLPVFVDTGGKTLTDSNIHYTELVLKPSQPVSVGEIPIFSNVDGNQLSGSGILTSDVWQNTNVGSKIAQLPAATSVVGSEYVPTDTGNKVPLSAIASLLPQGNVVGPSSSVVGNVAVFDSTDGSAIKDSGIRSADLVVSSGSVQQGNLVTFGNALGTQLSDSGVSPDALWRDDNFASKISSLPYNQNITGYESVVCDNGQRVYLSDIAALGGGSGGGGGGGSGGSGDVIGPPSSSDGNLPEFSGGSGKVIRDSGIHSSSLWTDSSFSGKIGSLQRLTSLQGSESIPCDTGERVTISDIASFVSATVDTGVAGPSSSTDGNLAAFNGVSGDAIRDSGIPSVSVWTDASFGAKIAGLQRNSSPTGSESVACSDGKRVTLSDIASMASSSGGSPDFESGWLAVDDTQLPFGYKANHGLGTAPSRAMFVLKCVMDGQGYTVGDFLIPFMFDTVSYNNVGCTLVWDDTTIQLLVADSAWIALAVCADTNWCLSEALLDVYSWNVKIFAWR